jgi:hypothetical protein
MRVTVCAHFNVRFRECMPVRTHVSALACVSVHESRACARACISTYAWLCACVCPSRRYTPTASELISVDSPWDGKERGSRRVVAVASRRDATGKLLGRFGQKAPASPRLALQRTAVDMWAGR